MIGLSGAHVGEDLRITEGEMYVGSGWDSDVVITTPEVSRKHAKLTSAGGVTLLEDNGSATGVFVNGEPLHEPRVLLQADKIRFGVGEFLYFAAESSSPSSAVDPSLIKVIAKCPTHTVGWLSCRSGEFSGLDFRLTKGLNRVGSLPGIEVVLPDQNLNSIHLTLEASLERIYLRPGFASLRVMRAGQHVEHPGRLQDGDLLIIGALELGLRSVA